VRAGATFISQFFGQMRCGKMTINTGKLLVRRYLPAFMHQSHAVTGAAKVRASRSGIQGRDYDHDNNSAQRA
jgi:hypothetical protein